MLKIIVIGGLSAGPSAAAKARRENEEAEIILYEKSDNISYATCGIPYALSGKIDSREKLLVTDVKLLQNRFNIDVRIGEEVIGIDPVEKMITTLKGKYKYDKLVYATGARAFVPPIEQLENAENWSTCRTLSDYDRIKEHVLIDEVQHVTVMGAGLIGIEVAENLALAGKKVTIIEGGSHILPMWQAKFSGFAQNVLEDHGIDVIKGIFVHKVEVNNKRITDIHLQERGLLQTDYVIMGVGIKPNTEMLKALGAQTLRNGALVVDEFMQTSIPDIYAAGDNVGIKNMLTDLHDYLPLGTHSNKGGRTAGYNSSSSTNVDAYPGGYKTAIIQLFDFTLGRTGMGPRDLELEGILYKRSLIVAGATPGYYPNQKDMIIETYYNAETHVILGAELFGEHGVDKRLDVLSTAIYAGLKMEDLSNLDLAYAPPYSPAKDPVVVNGYVANNHLHNNYSEICVEELRARLLRYDDLQIVDLRTQSEVDSSEGIPFAIHIPLDDLRSRLHELDANKSTIVYCQKGLRGYIGFKILKHHGFSKMCNLAGGYKVWQMYTRQFPVELLMEEYMA